MLGGSANTTVYIIPVCGGKAGGKYVACVCTGITGGGRGGTGGRGGGHQLLGIILVVSVELNGSRCDRW